MSQPLEPQAPSSPSGKKGMTRDAPTKTTTLSKVALGFGIATFVFSVIPGAIIVGWVLAPVAFVLGIIAVAQKGKKTFGIITLVLAVVGVVASFVVLAASVGSALNEVTEVTVEEPAGDEDAQPGEDGKSEDEPGAGGETEDAEDAGGSADADGSRDNPVQVGSQIKGSEWTVVVNSVTPDATSEVMEANQFNDEPESGMQYMVVDLSATYTGEDSSTDSLVSVAFVADSGEVYSQSDTFAVAPDPQFGMNELYQDATSTGNVVLQVPAGAEGLLRVSPGLFADEVFVALP